MARLPRGQVRRGRILLVFGGALLLVVALGAIVAHGGAVTPGENAQSLGNAASQSLLATPPTATATVTATETPKPTASAIRTANGCTITPADVQAEQFLLGRLNQHRQDAGVAPLTLNAKLTAGARAHSCDMQQHDELSHDGSDGSTITQRIQSTGLALHSWGENVGTAAGSGLIGGVTLNDKDMMAEPMEQYNHRWNILNKGYTMVGIGIVYVNGQEWLTEDFAG